MLIVVFLLANDSNEFPEYTELVGFVRLEDERFEVKIQRIRFESNPLMRPGIFRDGFLASIDFHGVLPAGVWILDVPALDDDDLAIY
jgi:hypothetical protein